jgi:hypothetical protein
VAGRTREASQSHRLRFVRSLLLFYLCASPPTPACSPILCGGAHGPLLCAGCLPTESGQPGPAHTPTAPRSSSALLRRRAQQRLIPSCGGPGSFPCSCAQIEIEGRNGTPSRPLGGRPRTPDARRRAPPQSVMPRVRAPRPSAPPLRLRSPSSVH